MMMRNKAVGADSILDALSIIAMLVAVCLAALRACLRAWEDP
jgi:hypothetical protein